MDLPCFTVCEVAKILRLGKTYSRYSDGSLVTQVSEVSPQTKPILTEIMNTESGKWIFLDVEEWFAPALDGGNLWWRWRPICG